MATCRRRGTGGAVVRGKLGSGPTDAVSEVAARRQSAGRASRALSQASREGGGQQHTATGPIRRPCCLERTCPRVRVSL